MSVKIFHDRVKDTNGSPMTKGGTTIAYEFDEKEKIFSYALAHCHYKDNYNKHIGRMKAAGRLNSNNHKRTFTAMTEQDGLKQLLCL